MFTKQELFDKACSSLRTYGNPYGSFVSRKWAWTNPSNPGDRCAIARFVEGNDDFEVKANLSKECNYCPMMGALVVEITQLFDYWPEVCNDPEKLENKLKEIADKFKLKYTTEYEARLKNLEEISEQAQELSMGY